MKSTATLPLVAPFAVTRAGAFQCAPAKVSQAKLPQFSLAQWAAIIEVIGHEAKHQGMKPASILWCQVGDADRLLNLGQRWGIDALQLAYKLLLTPHSVLDEMLAVGERFHHAYGKNTRPTADQLRQSGAGALLTV